LSEVATRSLMSVLAAMRQPSQARRAYRQLETRLHEELDEAPSAEMQAFARELRAAPTEASPRAGDAAPRPTPARETVAREIPRAPGEEFPARERASERLRGGEFLLRTTTLFFGRETEIGRLAELLAAPRTRLVTLTGPGGTGKTRLALETAAHLVEAAPAGAPTAAAFVPLADVREPERLYEVILRALGELPSATEKPLEQLAAVLRSRPGLLLILDNFEQLVEEGALRVRELLARAAVKLLVTSRQKLRIEGEQEFPLGPLPIPTTDDRRATTDEEGTGALALGDGDRSSVGGVEALMRFAAIALFVDRAEAARPDFQLTERNAAAVRQLCERLEGIPLALELAAARISVLAPERILEQVSANRLDFLASGRRDLPSRQQTLRATLEWSYRLLPAAGQRFLAALSVFRGGWSLEAVQAVCRQSEKETLGLLMLLRDSSLIGVVEAEDGLRFRMLETVREYAAERLADWGETEAVQARHREFFLALAEQAEPELEGPEQSVWLERLEREHDNLRAALAACLAAEEGAVDGLRLAGALRRFWEVRNYFSEGRASLAAVLRIPGAAAPTAARARALTATGVLAWRQGDHAAARALHEEGLALWRQLGNERGIAYSLYYLARVIPGLPDSQTEAALEIFRRVGDKLGMAHALNWLGELALESGDAHRARRLYEESLQLKREVGDRWEVAHSVHNLGMAAYVRGDYTEARQLFEESLAISRKFGDPRGAAWSLHELGNVAAREGEGGRARELYQEGLTLFRGWGDKRGIAWSLHRLTLVAIRQGEYATARTRLAEVQRLWRAEEYPRGTARSLLQEGLLAFFQGDYRVARERFEEGLALFREHADPRGIELALRHVGMVAARQGEYALARQSLEESLAIARASGLKGRIANSLHYLGEVADREGNEGTARALYAESLTMFRQLGKKLRIALSSEAFAHLAAREDAERAARLWGAAEALRERLGAPLPPNERAEYEREVAAVRQALGAEGFAVAWAAGRSLTEEQAGAYALGEGSS
jgi:predicted ATPase